MYHCALTLDDGSEVNVIHKGGVKGCLIQDTLHGHARQVNGQIVLVGRSRPGKNGQQDIVLEFRQKGLTIGTYKAKGILIPSTNTIFFPEKFRTAAELAETFLVTLLNILCVMWSLVEQQVACAEM